MYGLDDLTNDFRIENQIPGLSGVLSDIDAPVSLPCIKTNGTMSADITILPDTNTFWILLEDATEKEKRQLLLQQKGNALSLLEHAVSKLPDELRKTITNNLNYDVPLSVYNLLEGLDIILLEETSPESFRLIGPMRDWFQQFLSDAVDVVSSFKPQDHISFIDHFLFDARPFWEKASKGRIKSGPFIQSDINNIECALEVSALKMGQRNILLIELLGSAYEERKLLLQRARENTLIRDYLEEEISKRTADIRHREDEIARRLVWAAESRDEETGAHIRRIGLYSEALADRLGWPQQQKNDILIASTMHDIGKIGIPDRILRKPGKLTREECLIMKTHTEIGAKILDNSSVPMIQMAKDIALSHHEKWDGSGYPRGLSGNDIPESARIVIIADIYDAMITQRVYKAAEPEINVIQMMKDTSARFFDPDIFNCFLSILPVFKQIRETFPGVKIPDQ